MTVITPAPATDHHLYRNSIFENVIAGISLGILTGWCYILFLVIYPCLGYLIFFHQSPLAVAVLTVFIYLTMCPLDHTQQNWFMKSWFFQIWRNYFQHTYDCPMDELKKGQKYLFCEFPHAVFPMGQFLCAPVLDELIPRNERVCGIGADIVFSVPGLRQIMSWIGTRRATREGIRTILANDSHVTVLPGGIAEMYLVNPNVEAIYLRKRHNTVRMAIEEGLHIVPEFSFGNSRLYTILGGKEKTVGEEASLSNLISSFVFRLSRKLRMSLLLFYGCFGTIPRALPLHLVRGKVIEVEQCDNPTDEQVQKVLDQLIEAVEQLYKDKKPDWEDRPLVIY
jgi:diacylglycerol O-acyltransferase 2, plant